MIAYIPKNLNQVFFITIYENGTYLMTDSDMDSPKTMYHGKNRLYVERMVKSIRTLNNKSVIKIYKVVDGELKLQVQSHFYNI